MAPNKKPCKLSDICVDVIYDCINNVWMNEGGLLRRYLDEFPMSKTSYSAISYVMGPFESLNDYVVAYILKKLYRNNELNRSHLLVLLHNRLLRLDLSFITKKKNTFVNPSIATFIGNTCNNLIELNLMGQTELTANNLCSIINSMKHLKILNLSHTKSNINVTDSIAKTCTKLENLYLNNCLNLYDNCIEILSENLYKTLTLLSIDNIDISNKLLIQISVKCKNLKYLYACNLVDAIQSLYKNSLIIENKEKFDNNDDSDYEIDTDKETKITGFDGTLKLDTFYADSGIVLKTYHMEALSIVCPHLKKLHINCIGSSSHFNYLNNFNFLNELLLANTTSLMCFEFKGPFLDAIKNSLGKQLKSLHLTNIVDVNLRSIAKYCKNLVKLNVDFIGYYEPSHDPSLEPSDFNAETINKDIGIKSLRSLSLSNSNNRYEQRNLNIGQFKQDLKLLLSNSQVEYLNLKCLSELEDEYFGQLFTTPVPIDVMNVKRDHKFIIDSITTIEINELNCLTPELVLQYLILSKNSLKNLSLINCKMIGRKDILRMEYIIKIKFLDCCLKWS